MSDQTPAPDRNRLLDGLAACVTRAMASPQRADVQDIMTELGIEPHHAVTTASVRDMLEAALR